MLSNKCTKYSCKGIDVRHCLIDSMYNWKVVAEKFLHPAAYHRYTSFVLEKLFNSCTVANLPEILTPEEVTVLTNYPSFTCRLSSKWMIFQLETSAQSLTKGYWFESCPIFTYIEYIFTGFSLCPYCVLWFFVVGWMHQDPAHAFYAPVCFYECWFVWV